MKAVLLLDEEAPHRLLAKRALRNLPHLKIVEAEGLSHARDAVARTEIFSLFLIDLNLGEDSGLQFIEELRADARYRETPILIISTSDLEKDYLAAYCAGVSAFLVKNSDLSQYQKNLLNAAKFFLKS